MSLKRVWPKQFEQRKSKDGRLVRWKGQKRELETKMETTCENKGEEEKKTGGMNFFFEMPMNIVICITAHLFFIS